ncbi:MAG TPA: lysozyme inhibitor LprI family protein [Longimicrobium sp.]|nr:lysozyme inhibitor LprI family protein [Longimicrobium sp.]
MDGARRTFRGWTVAAALVAALGVSAPAEAQEFRENVAHPCQDYWMVPRAEIVACLRRDLAAADAELNGVYAARIAALPPAGREALRADQRAWLARYERVLTSYYTRPWANHSLARVLPSQILALRERTAYLRRARITG